MRATFYKHKKIIMEYTKQSGTERPNKSQQKREIAALKTHAEFLCKLKKKDYLKLRLNNEILNGLEEFSLIKQPNAQKRHVQFMTRLLSDFNELDTLLEQLHQLQNPHLKQQHLEKQVEQQIAKLLEGQGDTIDQLFSDFPKIDKQQFMQILRNAQKEKQQDVNNTEEIDKQKTEGKQLKKLKSLLREILQQR